MRPLESSAGIVEIEASGPELLVAAVSCARKASQPVEKCSQRATFADLGKDKTDGDIKNLGCVRFDQKSLGLTVEQECERTPQYNCAMRSTLPCPLSLFAHTCSTKSIRKRAHVSHCPDPSESKGGRRPSDKQLGKVLSEPPVEWTCRKC